MKALYITWQDPETRRWHTIGRLDHEERGYRFVYTQGALALPRFEYLGRMRDKRQVYHSDTCFPSSPIACWIPPGPSTPIIWAGWAWTTRPDTADDLELLVRSGGRRGTGRLCVYPEMESRM